MEVFLMALPVRHRPAGALRERMPSWGEPMAEELDELFDRMSRFLESASAMPTLVGRTSWAPMADMYETDDAYVVEVEFPGVARENIDVEIAERELLIKAETAPRESEGVMRRSTRRSGTFEYRAMLPAGVKSAEVGAQLSDGVLTVTIPKAQPVKPRHVEITAKD
jgi:HSP20 family protein